MKVLVISAHPDDETLGCGGTLLKHRDAGDELHWLVVTQPHPPQWSAELVELKIAEIEQAAKAYQMEHVYRLGFPTIQLDTVPQAELIGRIQEVIAKVEPELVYLVHEGDVHTDHQVVFTAAMSVLKSFYMQRYGVKRILCFETLSSTEAAPAAPGRHFVPLVYIDISSHIEEKLSVMKLFASEAQEDPMPRGEGSIRALARYRGATIGVDYAEAFMLIREVA